MTEATPLRTYIINFNARETDLSQFVGFIQTHPLIRSYWNYLPLVYCVKTTLLSEPLAKMLVPFFPSGQFMVAEINPFNANGLLPKAAWDWFYTEPPPSSPLGGLMSLGEALTGRSALSDIAPSPPRDTKSGSALGLLSGLFNPEKKEGS